MTELYKNVSEEFRKRVKAVFEMATRQPTLVKGVKTLYEFLKTCSNEEEREYASLSFAGMLMENTTDENSNDQR